MKEDVRREKLEVGREKGEGRSSKEDKRKQVSSSVFASHFSHLTFHFFLFFSKKEII